MVAATHFDGRRGEHLKRPARTEAGAPQLVALVMPATSSKKGVMAERSEADENEVAA
jgi:hypothetical protein